MDITDKTVEKIATLAKLEFEGEAKENIKADLNKIIGFVSKLDELDTTGVEPLLHVTDRVNVMREDEVKNEVPKADALQNGPSTDSDYFKVPSVMKDKS